MRLTSGKSSSCHAATRRLWEEVLSPPITSEGERASSMALATLHFRCSPDESKMCIRPVLGLT